MATDKSVLIIGLIPELVDFSHAPPGMNAAKVRAGFDIEVERIKSAGYDARSLLVDLGETAEAEVVKALREKAWPLVCIGAGVRFPQYIPLFEKIVNAVHQHAPAAKFCFNTNPTDTLDALKRWL